jgi:hypothetical protein
MRVEPATAVDGIAAIGLESTGLRSAGVADGILWVLPTPCNLVVNKPEIARLMIVFEVRCS